MKGTVVVSIALILFLSVNIPVLAQEESKDSIGESSQKQSEESARESEEASKGKNYFLNLSLFYPISINKTKHDQVNVNLGLIYSRVGYVYGLDLSLIGSAIEHRLEGVQLCGLGGVIGNSGKGIQLAGLLTVTGDSFIGGQGSLLMNIAGDRITGIQATGLMNITGDEGSGIQMSGLANIMGDRGRGLQLSGGFNIVGDEFQGIQAVGLFNIVGENLSGAQAAGLFNITGGELRGFQLGSCNVAAYSDGAQIGLVNVAGTSKGVQIGLVNTTKGENTGLAIGPINLAENGRVRGILWGGNSVGISGGAKFTISRMYSIASLGFFNMDDNINSSVSYGIHYGVWFPINRLSLNADLGYRYRDNTPLFKKTFEKPDQHILEARVTLEIPLSERLSLLVGTGIGRAFDSGKNIDTGKTTPLITAGIEFF